MIKDKKALSSYLIIILSFAVLMTVILFPLLGTIYAEDNKSCQYVKFNLKDMCKKSGFVVFKIENTGKFDFNVYVNSKKFNEVKMGKEIKIREYTTKKTVKITPQINDKFNDYTCNSKTQKIKMELIPLC